LGFANTNVIYALIKSGVIEQLRESSKTLEQLSSECKLNSDVLFRILRFAIAIDLIALSDDLYSLTDTGRFLLKDIPGSLYGGMMLIGTEPWQKSWNNLLQSLTTGEASFDKVMGSPFFDYLNMHPEYGEPYNKWMTTISVMASKTIPEAYDFSTCKTICDIGGGQGLLLKGILEANPNLHGILYDQESVVKDHLLGEIIHQAEIKSGNFFESVPSAEVLMMKSVLHDWDDKKSLRILNACKKVMTQNTKLLIIEMVIGSNSDLTGFFYDLHMQTMLAGKERTEDEFTILLQKAGLKFNRLIPTKSPMKIIEAAL
jgi:hypothetical protein